jgi:ADP-ribose pyrophosphatase YjhB (NUDIX family)
MITKFQIFESLTNFDLDKLVTVTTITKDKDNNWIYKTTQRGELILPKEDAGKISLVDDKLTNFVNSGHPITKYFEIEGNKITYAANFAADVVALNQGRVYLIERKDGRGWALPGGFIDVGETPEQAAIRELQEETKAKLKDIISVEPLGLTKANDPREINVYTYPFLVRVKNPDEFKYGDDAKAGKWYLLTRASKSKLAFPHHNDILKQVYF